ncbi:OsmC family protein [Shimia thalassica]|uniref:OsmC family protein n=1 Tax=Shimia thalassica TaxID=1715693 RepID=UPI0027366010|nr:OsmC family protein [Shimia thalassica]MDP2519729.1 OsmC family protein [Shimia thalassica]
MAGIKMKTTVKLRAHAECQSHSRADIQIRDLSFAIDEPVERGGSNLGPTPTDTAIAALIGCTNVIGHKCAKALGVEIGHLSIDAVCDFDRRGVTLQEEIEVPFSAITLNVVSDGVAQQEELDRVAEETEKYCPLSKLFKAAGTKVEAHWSKL